MLPKTKFNYWSFKVDTNYIDPGDDSDIPESDSTSDTPESDPSTFHL